MVAAPTSLTGRIFRGVAELIAAEVSKETTRRPAAPDAERAEDPGRRLRSPPAVPIPAAGLLVLFLFLVVQVRGVHGRTSFWGGRGCSLV